MSSNKYVFGVNYGPKPTVPPNSSSSLSGMSHILKSTESHSRKPATATRNNGMGLLNLSNSAKDAILGAVQHPRSYARIQEIEAPKPAPQEVPDLPHQVCTEFLKINIFDFQPPAFVKQLGPAIQCMEGDNVYLEAQVTPTDDNSLTVRF